MSAYDISGQTAVVTGGGTGIGRAIVLGLVEQGVQVVVAGRREAPLDETVEAIEKAGGKGLAVPTDVTSFDDVHRLVDMTAQHFGTVDILVNNAGIVGGAPIHKHTIADWDQVMAVNLRGPFLLARAVLPLMRTRQRGHLINISSESGLAYYEGNGAYGVSKHALNALGEFIQRENQELGIRVDTVCPGMVLTPMSENSPGLNHEDCLTPEDVADLVLWLLTRRPNVKIGRPLLIQTMKNPWA